MWRNDRLRPRARSKNANPSPPLCEITDTWPLPSGRFGSSGPAVISIAGLKRRAERGGDIGKAFGIGPAHRHVVALRGGADRRLHAGAGFARLLGKARTQNDGGFDAGAAAALQLFGHEFRRNDQDGEIGRLRKIGDRGIGLAALHFRGAAAHRINRAGVRMAEHHFQDAAAQAVQVGRGADHGDRFRPEQFSDIRHRAPPFNAGRGRAR